MKKEIDFILENLSNERFSISELIDISFILKKLLKGNEISFSDLIKPSGGIYWENISIIIPYLPVEIIENNLDKLLESFMDLNWPGTRIFYGYLSGMKIDVLKNSFLKTINYAIEVNDTDWVYFLLVFLTDDRVGLEIEFEKEIYLCRNFLILNGIDDL